VSEANIAWLDPGDADDGAIVSRVVDIVNLAYLIAEAKLWSKAIARTNAGEVRAAIEAGEIGAARIDGRIIGAIRARAEAKDLWWFGALGVDPSNGGRGIGASLVGAAERRARDADADSMRLELLFPDPPLPHFERLARWYDRLGYRETGRVPLAEKFPADAPFLTRECNVIELRRVLGAS
jgi:GNAT superfamily N-acetyltransferase